MDRGVFQDLTVINLSQGLPGVLLGKFCAEMGAKVIRPYQAADEQFETIYPAWSSLSACQEKGPTIAADMAQDPLIASADICLLGGEDLPGISRTTGATALSEKCPNLIAVEIGAYPEDAGKEGAPGTDILMQAASGLVNEQSEERPVFMAFQPAVYGSTLLALIGLTAALIERERCGLGQAVLTSLFEGAVLWRTPFWFDAERSPPGIWISRPKDAPPLIFKCADGRYIHLSLSTPNAMETLQKILGIDEQTATESNLVYGNKQPDAAKFYGDTTLWAPLIAQRSSEDLLASLDAAGLNAEPCLAPGECWKDPQVDSTSIIRLAKDGSMFVGNPISLRGSGKKQSPLPVDQQATPLSGIRVIDLGTFVAGPLASVVLADLGADVIKVESFAGDATRRTFWWNATVNRGKRNILLDLKAPVGLEIFKRLCAGADLVTHNFRVGVVDRLKIDPANLMSEFPQLSMLETPAYGLTGPRAQSSGVDMTMQAYCGHEWRGGGTGNPPLWNRLTFVDVTAGLLGSIAALLCIYHRSRTRESSRACVSLLDAGLFLMSEALRDAEGSCRGAKQVNRAQSGFDPGEAFYKTRDGWVAVSVRDQSSWERFLAALQLADVVSETLRAASDHANSAISDAIANQSTADIVDLFGQHQIWAAPLESGKLAERQNLISQFTIQDPNFGRVHQIWKLFRLSLSTTVAPKRAPAKGEHSAEILAELGYDDEEVAALFSQDIVR